MDPVTYCTSATTNHFQNITKFIYIFTATNFWFGDVKISSVFVKFNKYISKFLEVLVGAFVITGFGARYTQDSLTEKQTTDVIMKSLSSIFVYTMYVCTLYHKEGIKELLFTLTVTLKEMFNDEKVEKMMIRKNYLFLAGLMLVGCCPMVAYGLEGAVHTLTTNSTFTTVIPIWPKLEDRRLFAGVARVLIYIVWLLLVAHVMCIYGIIITVSICLGHQFANLYEYFLSLNDIFTEDSVEEQEKNYEYAVRDGLKMHCITLRCVEQLQTTCNVAYSGQVLINVCVMLLLMIQMMQAERSLVELAPIVFMATGVLVSSGLFIWSAGDITFEAQRLPTAMFHSGWHNCRGKSSVRVRKMIMIAMVEAQRPVVIRGLGIIELSYESYVAIVKSSYSVFSVIY